MLSVLGPVMLAVLGVCVIVAGWRVRSLIPAHFARCSGVWIDPRLQFSAERYTYEVDKVSYVGATRVKVSFRRSLGRAVEVAFDPADPATSYPAQLRTQGAVLIVTGGCSLLAAAALPVFVSVVLPLFG